MILARRGRLRRLAERAGTRDAARLRLSRSRLWDGPRRASRAGHLVFAASSGGVQAGVPDLRRRPWPDRRSAARACARSPSATAVPRRSSCSRRPRRRGRRVACVLTLGLGRRFLIVDGVERWKDAEVAELLAPALAQIAPETTVAFFAREEGRAKAPAALHEAVRSARGRREQRADRQGVGAP